MFFTRPRRLTAGLHFFACTRVTLNNAQVSPSVIAVPAVFINEPINFGWIKEEAPANADWVNFPLMHPLPDRVRAEPQRVSKLG